MNKIIYRYIFFRIIIMIILVAIVLGLLTFISALFAELNRPGHNNFWIYILKDAPYLIKDSLPLACVIAMVFVVRKMMNSNELTIVRLMGIKGGYFVLLFGLPALVAGLGALFWVELVAVPLHKKFTDDISSVDERHTDIWVRKDAEVIYLDKLSLVKTENKTMQIANVASFHFANSQLDSYTQAKQIVYHDNNWFAQHIVKWRKDNNVEHNYSAIYFVPIQAQVLFDYVKHKRSQDIFSLYRTVVNNRSIGLEYKFKNLEFWSRLSTPLIFVSLALLVAFLSLLYPSRSSLVLNVILAIVAGFSLEFLFRIVGYFSLIVNIPLGTAMLLPPIVLIFVSGYLIAQRV